MSDVSRWLLPFYQYGENWSVPTSVIWEEATDPQYTKQRKWRARGKLDFFSDRDGMGLHGDLKLHPAPWRGFDWDYDPRDFNPDLFHPMNVFIKSKYEAPPDPKENRDTIVVTAIFEDSETVDPDFLDRRWLDKPTTAGSSVFGEWGGYDNPWLVMILLKAPLAGLMESVKLATPDFHGIAG